MDTNVSSSLLKTPSSELIAQEWVVVGERTEQVSWAGDSGGLFLDEGNKRVAGMIIGGYQTRKCLIFAMIISHWSHPHKST